MSVYQVWIGAPTKKEAVKIAKFLVVSNLVAGAFVVKGISFYRWENKVNSRKDDFNVIAYSTTSNKKRIIQKVQEIHSYVCPVIAFINVGGNKEFLDWVKHN